MFIRRGSRAGIENITDAVKKRSRVNGFQHKRPTDFVCTLRRRRMITETRR